MENQVAEQRGRAVKMGVAGARGGAGHVGLGAEDGDEDAEEFLQEKVACVLIVQELLSLVL